MSQDTLIKMKCDNCKNINYWTTKNKKSVQRKLEYKKFCKVCRAHKVHKEIKKK